MNIRISIAEDVSDISVEWDKLAKKVGEHFLHYPGWYEAQCKAYPKEGGIFFVTIYDDQGLAAVLPFQQSILSFKKLSIPIVSLFYSNEMGVADITSRINLKPYRRQIFRSIQKQGIRFWLIKFHSVLSSSHVFQCELFTVSALCKHSHVSKFLDIAGGIEPFYQRRNKKLLRNIRQKQGYVRTMGDVVLRSVSDRESLVNAYENFLNLEASGWKGEACSSIQQQPQKRLYYDQLFDSYVRNDALVINELLIGNQCVASQFSIRCGSSLYLLKIAYDESVSRISPGYLLLHELIRYHGQMGELNKISFVTGVGWMDRWYPDAEQVWVGYDMKYQWINKWAGIGYRWWQSRR